MLGKANAVVLCFVLQLFHCVFLIGSHQSGGGGGQKSMSSDKATSQAAAGSPSMGKWTQNLGVLFFPSIHTLAYDLYAFIPLLDMKLLRMEAEDLCYSVHVSQCQFVPVHRDLSGPKPTLLFPPQPHSCTSSAFLGEAGEQLSGTLSSDNTLCTNTFLLLRWNHTASSTSEPSGCSCFIPQV